MRIFTLLLLCLFASFPALAENVSQKNLDKGLIYYTYFGKPADVVRMLSRGASPNALGEKDWSAVAIAANRNDGQALPLVKLLVVKGADVNLRVPQGQDPLTVAVERGDVVLVMYLALKGADVGVKNALGYTLDKEAEARDFTLIRDVISKLRLEKDTYQQFLMSPAHNRQLLRSLAYNNCAAQYINYYVNSKQDADMDVKALGERMRDYIARFTADMTELARYFPQDTQAGALGSAARGQIVKNLDDLISNRNRRQNGVGQGTDIVQRCSAISLNLVPRPAEAVARPE